MRCHVCGRGHLPLGDLHACMSAAAQLELAYPCVFMPHAFVKGQGLIELLHQWICGTSESAAP